MLGSEYILMVEQIGLRGGLDVASVINGGVNLEKICRTLLVTEFKS